MWPSHVGSQLHKLSYTELVCEKYTSLDVCHAAPLEMCII